MKVLFLVPALGLLAACGGKVESAPPPVLVPVEVAVPIAGGCVPDATTPPPEYIDSDSVLRGAVDAAERYQLVLAGRAQRNARLNEIEPIVASCPRGKSK